jgi:hypothetical protein
MWEKQVPNVNNSTGASLIERSLPELFAGHLLRAGVGNRELHGEGIQQEQLPFDSR